MKLEQVVPYLIDLQLLDARDLVCGEVRVDDRSSRNRAFAVHATTRAGYFVKCAQAGEVGALDAEARIYDHMSEGGAFAALASYVPVRRHFEPHTQVLTTELVIAAHDIHDCARSAELSRNVAASLGHALAAVHASDVNGAGAAVVRQMIPWAFNVVVPSPEIFRDIAPLQLELVRLVQQQPGVVTTVQKLRGDWQCTTFMHGDVRWGNVLVASDRSVRLIDWEAAGTGDAAWDVGCAMQGWIELAVDNLDISDQDELSDASTRFTARLPQLQDQIRTMWHAYLESARLDEADAHELLDRSSSYAALRLLESAYEWARGRTRFTSSSILMLQAGVNLLSQPRDARVAFLGIAAP